MTTKTDAFAASFDCSAAHSILEVIICADPELSALDKEQGDLYNLHLQTSPSQKTEILAQQRKFLKERTQVCNIPRKSTLSEKETNQIIVCFKGYYTLRINELKKTTVGDKNDTDNTVENRFNKPQQLIQEPSKQNDHLDIKPSSQPTEQQSKALTSSQCEQSSAKKYYIATCVARGISNARKDALLANAEKNMEISRVQLQCSPDYIDKLSQSAKVSADRITASNAISNLMDFSDAINLECTKAEATLQK